MALPTAGRVVMATGVPTSDRIGATLRRGWQRARRRLGASGLLGCALGALALLALTLSPHIRDATDATRAALQGREEASRRMPASTTPALTEQQRADQIIKELPAFEQNAEDLRAVFASASSAHVLLEKGDYAVKSDAGSPIVTYTATFPVHESYAALKSFTANVLRALPHAALDELRLSRPDASDELLVATVRFTLIYRRP